VFAHPGRWFRKLVDVVLPISACTVGAGSASKVLVGPNSLTRQPHSSSCRAPIRRRHYSSNTAVQLRHGRFAIRHAPQSGSAAIGRSAACSKHMTRSSRQGGSKWRMIAPDLQLPPSSATLAAMAFTLEYPRRRPRHRYAAWLHARRSSATRSHCLRA
jgi:hypothetical protein